MDRSGHHSRGTYSNCLPNGRAHQRAPGSAQRFLASPSIARLCGFGSVKKRPPNLLRRFNLDKTVCGIKIIFSAFINDADIAFCGSVFVRHNLVDLVQFQ